MFFVDREGYQPIVDLLKLRDRLVHPKPGFGVSGHLGEPDTDFERLFAMPKVAEYIVMVGGSADLLMPRAYGFESVDVAGVVIALPQLLPRPDSTLRWKFCGCASS